MPWPQRCEPQCEDLRHECRCNPPLLVHRTHREVAFRQRRGAGCLENNLDFERRHLAILDRFGRYPHRNAILGRESTPEEIEFLKQPGAGF
jgi:uncharacterized protein (DUF924 family)